MNLVLVALLLWAAMVASGNTAILTVGPGGTYDYESIQAAITDAIANDIITVASGVYVERSAEYRSTGLSVGILFSQKNNITLQGSGSGQTFVDANTATSG